MAYQQTYFLSMFVTVIFISHQTNSVWLTYRGRYQVTFINSFIKW